MSDSDAVFYPMRPTMGGNTVPIMMFGRGYIWEPKYNGWRMLVNVRTGVCYNRRGKESSVGDEFKKAIEWLMIRFGNYGWLDCEALARRHDQAKGTLIVFDAPNLADQPYPARVDGLKAIPVLPVDQPLDPKFVNSPVFRPPQYETHQGVSYIWRYMQAANVEMECDFYEGLVAKKIGSRYHKEYNSSSRESPDWVKFRFRTEEY